MSSATARWSRPTPIAVHSDSTFAVITGTQGTPRSCAITPGATAYCWGYNLYGEVGDGSRVDRLVPTQVSGGIRFAVISTSYHTCGLDVLGLGYCWGAAIGGALGQGLPLTDTTTPARVATAIPFTTITTGLLFTCALDSSGRAYCWGWGAMVGAGGSPDSLYYAPVPVATSQRFVSLSAAEEHACGVTSEGAAFCWGKIAGPFDSITTTPTRVLGLPMVKAVLGGRQASCVLTVGGRALCGSLGDSLAVVADSIRFAGLSVGSAYACGFTPGGALFCWDEALGTLHTPVRVLLPMTVQ